MLVSWSNYDGGTLIPGGAHLWMIRSSRIRVGDLSSGEADRCRGIRNPESRSAFRAAHGGLRRILTFYRNEAAAEVPMRRGARGKPYVPDGPEFNLSHTAGRAVAAFASSPVGIDIESGRREVHAGKLAGKFFFGEERERVLAAESEDRNVVFLRHWVCKEAIVKLAGDGIYFGLREARADPSRGTGSYRGRPVVLWQFELAGGLLGALASWEPLTVKGFYRV